MKEKGMKKDKPKRQGYNSLFLSRYRGYKASAFKRGLSFQIDLLTFRALWQQNSYYCGGQVDSIGIDRKNNAFGYEPDNIVPCCKVCNFMKRQMSIPDFIAHCKKIVDFTESL